CFRVVGNISRKAALGILDILDCAVWILRHRTAEHIAEFILPGIAEIPVSVDDTVLIAAADLEGMLPLHPAQVVLELPAVLRERGVEPLRCADAEAKAVIGSVDHDIWELDIGI